MHFQNLSDFNQDFVRSNRMCVCAWLQLNMWMMLLSFYPSSPAPSLSLPHILRIFSLPGPVPRAKDAKMIQK